MEGKCIVSNCGNAASKSCGSCGWVRYCSAECQKEDWKKHHKKEECVNMKKLSRVSLTELEIDAVVYRITFISDRLSANGEDERNIDLLKEGIAFVRDRLSRLDVNDSHGLIGDCAKHVNFMMCRLLLKLGNIYYKMPRSSVIANHAISYISEARELLIERKDAEMDDMEMWRTLSSCEECLYQLYAERGQLEKAKYHAVQRVATARQYNGPNHVKFLSTALMRLSIALDSGPEALAFAEEGYILVSKHYNPAHKMVLQTSVRLINCLIEMKDYSTADTYCRMNYANVIDPMNTEEYGVEDRLSAMGLLMTIWLEKEPDDDEVVAKALADEAIDLSRKACAIIKESCKVNCRADFMLKFCRVLLKANELTEETEGLMHLLFTICIADRAYKNKSMYNALLFLFMFYVQLDELLSAGEESELVKENSELCHERLLKLESCDDSSYGAITGSHKIKPYFKNNAELCI